jgi:hypothetical protein
MLADDVVIVMVLWLVGDTPLTFYVVVYVALFVYCLSPLARKLVSYVRSENRQPRH